MARSGAAERPVRQPLLDRLVEGGGRGGSRPASRDASVRRLRASLLRDLEWLLNTRRRSEAADDDFPELEASLYNYGLPDISSMSADSPAVQQRLAREVQEALEVFEPRLAGVRVKVAEAEEGERRGIHLLIEGLLRMDPSPQRVRFDTVLEIASGRIDVRSRDG